MKEEQRHTCTNLGELQRYLGLQITRDRATRTIMLTRSHMVEQILTRFCFPFSNIHLTPLAVDNGLTAPPSDEPFESTSPNMSWVVKYVASTSGMGLVLGGKQPVTLTGFSDSSWANDAESLSYEADVYAAVMAAEKLCWLSFLLTDLGERPRLSPSVVRQQEQCGQALVRRVVSEANTADIFTKALPP
ncbi:unnamed protein product [Closterium sp. NIES-53]